MSTNLTITAEPDIRYNASDRPLIISITTPDTTSDVSGSGWRIGGRSITIFVQRSGGTQEKGIRWQLR